MFYSPLNLIEITGAWYLLPRYLTIFPNYSGNHWLTGCVLTPQVAQSALYTSAPVRGWSSTETQTSLKTRNLSPCLGPMPGPGDRTPALHRPGVSRHQGALVLYGQEKHQPPAPARPTCGCCGLQSSAHRKSVSLCFNSGLCNALTRSPCLIFTFLILRETSSPAASVAAKN